MQWEKCANDLIKHYSMIKKNIPTKVIINGIRKWICKIVVRRAKKGNVETKINIYFIHFDVGSGKDQFELKQTSGDRI